MAVDSNGNALSYDGSAWSAPANVDSAGGGLTSLSCPTASFCMAVDGNGRAVSYDPSGWSSPSKVDGEEGGLRSVSCATASFCVAIDRSSHAFAYNGSSWSAPTSIPGANAVSCPTTLFCAAVGIGGFLQGSAATYNGSSWSVPEIIDNFSLGSVSCSSASFCAAEGIDRYGDSDVVTYDGSAWNESYVNTDSIGLALSCPSGAFCTAADISGGQTVTYDGSSWSKPVGIDAAGVNSVSCTSGAFCAAVDGKGRALIYTAAAPPAPANVSPPAISGTPAPGQTLTETHGSWTHSPAAYGYQWEDCDSSGGGCAPIPGAAGQSYTLTGTDVGHTIRVAETASNLGGSSLPVSSSQTAMVVTPPANESAPTISGSAVEGQTLIEANGAWTESPIGYAYQWQDCDSSGGSCVPIPGADGQSYTLTGTDVGHTIRVAETASNLAGPSPPVSSSPTVVVLPLPPSNQSAPSISGSAVEGQTLIEANGVWTESPTGYAYQWQDCDSAGNACSPIPGATAQAYTLTATDVGHAVRVQESATNAGGTAAPATSYPTEVVQSHLSAPIAPSRQQIKASLRRQITPHGPAARLGRLIKTSRYTFTFRALSAGRVVIDWYFVPGGAHLASKARKPVLVARGSARFHAPGRAKLTIRLTRRGKRRLTRATRLTLTARGAAFAPSGVRVVTASRSFTLRR